jgi:serine/threonine protein kinase
VNNINGDYEIIVPQKGKSMRLLLSKYTSNDNIIDLLTRCLDINPRTRITVEDALNHPFFKEE